MAKYKKLSKKIHLGKQNKRTRWAPFWIIPKVFGPGKKVHPSRLTRIKRSWRRSNIDKAIKESKKRNIKSGRKKKKY